MARSGMQERNPRRVKISPISPAMMEKYSTLSITVNLRDDAITIYLRSGPEGTGPENGDSRDGGSTAGYHLPEPSKRIPLHRMI
jgi:hypothetical protein